jgi:hypothetical protein
MRSDHFIAGIFAALMLLASARAGDVEFATPVSWQEPTPAPPVRLTAVEDPAAKPEIAGTANHAEAAAVPAAMGEQMCPKCGQCHCATCECPVKPAPCQPCPHVSTLLPYWNVNIFGALQGNIIFNTARSAAPGIPMFLLPNAPEPENTVDVFARSSSLGSAFTGPEIGDFKSGGLVLALFYNDALIVDRYGVLPIEAFGELKNEDWRFAAGLQFNVFAPNLPTMLTFSSLIASGNAGNNFPGQLRLERYYHPSSDSDWILQGAISDPNPTGVASTDPVASIITGAPPLRITEDNGWPLLEGRIAYAVGDLKQEGLEQKRELEIGASVAATQLRNVLALSPNVVSDVFGLAADFRWRINDCWGIQGEVFSGQSLGFLNAGVLQSTNSVTFETIRSHGAWGEIYHYITPCLHTHWGAGIDNPTDVDLGFAQISRNETAFANLIWDATQQFRLGFELTYRDTAYAGLPENHGMGFHTQVQFSF